MNLDKEYEKLADLEFEYNISKLYGDYQQQIVAKGKYMRQLNKYKKLLKESEEKCEENS